MAQRDFSNVMNEQLARRTTGKNGVIKDISNEIKRLGTQGAMELAHVLFTGSAFTPYGPGQYDPKDKKQDQGVDNHQPAQTAQPEQQQERGGMEM